MKDVDRRLVALAGRQHGVVSREQARALGLTPSGLSYRIKRGHLVECGTSTLHLPGTVLTWYGRLTAGLLDLGPGALITGRGGAQLLGLDGFDRSRPTSWSPASGATTRRSDRSHHRPTSAWPIGASSTGSRARRPRAPSSSCSVAGRSRKPATRSTARAANASPIPVIERRLNQLGRQGRPGVAAFEQLTRAGVVESWLERQFIGVIRDAGLPEPVLQQRHELEGVGVARVDFEYPLWGVVVEVGGQRGYLSLDERRRKERRRNALQLEGKTIYFFTRTDVVDEPRYVVRTLAAALGTGHVPPGASAGEPA